MWLTVIWTEKDLGRDFRSGRCFHLLGKFVATGVIYSQNSIKWKAWRPPDNYGISSSSYNYCLNTGSSFYPKETFSKYADSACIEE